MKHLSLFALSAAALLLTSCATSTLWEKTNPREYLVIKWSPEAETRVQRRNVDYRIDLERGVMFVEKSDFRKTHDYLTRFFVTPIAVAHDAAVVGTVVGAAAYIGSQSGHGFSSQEIDELVDLLDNSRDP
jgi:hypothetical protein